MKKRNNNKGFTLIELLAVIVILALLMMIAIPSVTQYITQSRIKTVTKTMDSYITAVVQEVNDGEYHFSDATKIYAVPIECIALEKGGTNPFGEWMQANDNYWAYVLVQYDNTNYNYKYGFTFKDSAGYGLYPTLSEKIGEKKDQVRTGYDDLTKPKTDKAIEFVPADKWNGFDITSSTELIVLEATSEGQEGDKETTCTLLQKGDNYDEVEQKKEDEKKLVNLIKKHNTLITANPTLTTSSNYTSDTSGLYSSTATNSGNPTYYFRGNVTNNYVSFAGFTWRIIRINESGSIRLILNQRIGSNTDFSYGTELTGMYYSKSQKAKSLVNSWYNTNILYEGYDDFIDTEIFCEESRVKPSGSIYTSGNAINIESSEYSPNFKCNTDGNGYGILNLKVGLITYDEVIYAGGGTSVNKEYYLSNMSRGWTMSPAAKYTISNIWVIYNKGEVGFNGINSAGNTNLKNSYFPVINLNANVLATGTGISSDPYVVQTN